jgi:hypothetical protein
MYQKNCKPGGTPKFSAIKAVFSAIGFGSLRLAKPDLKLGRKKNPPDIRYFWTCCGNIENDRKKPCMEYFEFSKDLT